VPAGFVIVGLLLSDLPGPKPHAIGGKVLFANERATRFISMTCRYPAQDIHGTPEGNPTCELHGFSRAGPPVPDRDAGRGKRINESLNRLDAGFRMVMLENERGVACPSASVSLETVPPRVRELCECDPKLEHCLAEKVVALEDSLDHTCVIADFWSETLTLNPDQGGGLWHSTDACDSTVTLSWEEGRYKLKLTPHAAESTHVYARERCLEKHARHEEKYFQSAPLWDAKGCSAGILIKP
jgi:hypothetical protein